MASDNAVEIRPLATRSEYEECVALQREVWGAAYSEIVPITVMEIAARVGGICIGAFRESGDLVGFVFGVTGPRDGALTHWSHMLALREGWRGRGLGTRLKFAQRESAAALGAHSIQWTFDPLVSRNAHFNLNRLGVSVVRYAPDMYGPSGSELHRLGTDRLVVRWDLAEEGGATAPAGDGAEVAIPSDIDALQRRDLDEALAWRAAIRRELGGLLGDGYQVVGFDRGGDFGRYLLVRAAASGPSGQADG
ncbi:MAG: GNAT family N-acetyltransferase [Gemmatimonadetes bacterium]|nr:GNAT family N-acetyltransferase [Gemmatimonadota bacterium]